MLRHMGISYTENYHYLINTGNKYITDDSSCKATIQFSTVWIYHTTHVQGISLNERITIDIVNLNPYEQWSL